MLSKKSTQLDSDGDITLYGNTNIYFSSGPQAPPDIALENYRVYTVL